MGEHHLRRCPACDCFCIASLFEHTEAFPYGTVCSDCAEKLDDDEHPVATAPLQLVGGFSDFGREVLALSESDLD